MSNTKPKGKKTGLLLSGIGLVFMILAINFVLGLGNYAPYTELRWDSRVATLRAIDSVLSKGSLQKFVARRAIDTSGTGADTITVAANKLALLLRNVADSAISQRDSSWEQTHGKYISVTNDISVYDKLKDNDSILNVSVVLHPMRIPGFTDTVTYAVPVRHNVNSDDFFTRYPALALWALLMIIQLVFYAALLGWMYLKLFTNAGRETEDAILATNLQMRRKTVLRSVLAFLALCLALLWSDGNNMIKPAYFHSGLTYLMAAVSFGGYIAAGACIGYLLLVYMSMRMEMNAYENQEADTTNTETNDKATEAPANRKKYVKKYYELTYLFNTNFVLLSVTLTLGTMSIGSLFTGLSTLPLIKAITRSQGYTPFPQEYVTLFAILHTAILLSFYIIIHNRLKQWKKQLEIQDTDNPNDNSFFNILKDTIANGAPLLAPILQHLFLQF